MKDKPDIEQKDKSITNIIQSDTFKYIEPEPFKEKTDTKKSGPREILKARIARNKEVPSFNIDSITPNLESYLSTIDQLECNQASVLTDVYNQSLNQSFKHSSTHTGLYDGRSFCLKALNISDQVATKILYTRNEGGHSTDQSSVITVNRENKLIYTLPLSSLTQSEGHELLITSRMETPLIYRKIIQSYGEIHKQIDPMAKPARREIRQTIKINPDGSLKVINQEIKDYNMDLLH